MLCGRCGERTSQRARALRTQQLYIDSAKRAQSKRRYASARSAHGESALEAPPRSMPRPRIWRSESGVRAEAAQPRCCARHMLLHKAGCLHAIRMLLL